MGIDRSQYPHTLFIVCGTQAEKTDRNSLMVVKMSNLTKTLKVRLFINYKLRLNKYVNDLSILSILELNIKRTEEKKNVYEILK